MDMDKIRHEFVSNTIVDFVLTNFITSFDRNNLPLDQSLVDLGVLDSYGVVELVSFLEDRWSIVIPDKDITREKMGSIDKIANLVLIYTSNLKTNQ